MLGFRDKQFESSVIPGRETLVTQSTSFRGAQPASRPNGFTVLELLVVIAIIGLLVALLLPAVQQAREAARRTQCKNHLKQIGLALHNYHDIHQTFPPGYISQFDSSGNDTGPGWGWAAFILPQIEQQNVSDRIQFNKLIEDPANGTIRVARIETYFCPSDSASQTWTAKKYDLSGTPQSTVCEVASANYVAVYGTTEPGVDGDGIFYRNSKIRMADVTDGTSSTLMVGERSFRLGPATWTGVITGANLYPLPGSPSPPVLNNPSGMTLGHTGDGNGPNGSASYVNQFYSLHTGGVHFLFCDGHVGFLSSSMNYKTYLALTTRSGSEPVQGDF